MDPVVAKSNSHAPPGKNSSADRVIIHYYTDPLCCWSWALEPHWRKLINEYKDFVVCTYVMGGMIQDWKTYNDPMNAVTRPLQLGPVWMHASQIADIQIDYSIWHNDPPASSFPACVAVKCAALQSKHAEEMMLNRLREAVMTRGINIAKQANIFSIAKDASESEPSQFDLDFFREAWEGGAGAEQFRKDLQQTRFLKIGRYPTLTFTDKTSKGIMITGYRPYDILQEALVEVLRTTGLKN